MGRLPGAKHSTNRFIVSLNLPCYLRLVNGLLKICLQVCHQMDLTPQMRTSHWKVLRVCMRWELSTKFLRHEGLILLKLPTTWWVTPVCLSSRFPLDLVIRLGHSQSVRKWLAKPSRFFRSHHDNLWSEFDMGNGLQSVRTQVAGCDYYSWKGEGGI